MNPTLFALCQKPVLGPLLWITAQCGFPPPLPETPISLASPGHVLSASFDVPVSKGYFLSLTVGFPSIEARLNDTLIGAKYDVPCYGKDAKTVEDFPKERHEDLGKPVRLYVTVKQWPDGTVIYNKAIASICRAGHDLATKKIQVLALAAFAEGQHLIEVQNIEARPDLAGLTTSLTIHSGGK
ncbi:MAG: hypothetical protein ACKN9T_01920 [Candidatus Methylumidiphilus sp.]